MVAVTVPDFPAQLEWLNSPPLSLREELRHKLVVLDFWTFCCINCMHVLPDLAALEEKYADQPVVFVGIHSPKFTNEKKTENVRQAVLRYNVTHPVVNDPEMELWRSLEVTSWPTLVLLGPEGNLLSAFGGEGHRHNLDACLQAALLQYKGVLDHTPLALTPEASQQSPSTLLFPGKLTASKHLFISDSNHHRIVVTDLQGKVERVIGSGQLGMVDGSFSKACFFQPQGIALAKDQLFVADTENHALRQVDLTRKTVTTIAGNGVQGYDRTGGEAGRQQLLSSPWDVVVYDGLLLVAMAGTHQIWAHEISSGRSWAISGSGAEARLDGDDPAQVAWAQPSGFALVDDHLYVADSESSSIRRLDLRRHSVTTLIGGDKGNARNLFAFGDHDGIGFEARLQHPLGLTWLASRNRLVIADSYNHRLKLVDPHTCSLERWIGDGEAGYVDGDPHLAQFSEPAGVTVSADQREIYVADTNNHAIRIIDIATSTVNTLEIEAA